ncbi:MAG: cytochrome b N-terminal domain-containing protein [Anaerolineae bacterium]|nr:cytochrome b N-terminal domain-containing protein [Anaerolineae bacterium]
MTSLHRAPLDTERSTPASARLADDSRPRPLALPGLIQHLHPARVPERTLRFTYTYGLGGLGILLFLLLAGTGLLLAFVYTPSPAEAYASIVHLQTDVWFGQLIRNLHHWCGNLLLVVVVLHLLRVFYTAAFREPRRLNWLFGLLLLLGVMLASFSGYVLPWDQLSYWAATVLSGLVGYVPVIGDGLRELLVGGSEIGAVTLRNVYALHILLLPLLFVTLLAFHIWRVRKDKLSIPRALSETEGAPRSRLVASNPSLVGIEIVAALVAVTLILAWASLVDAPLLAAADPTHPPNPMKAAWYFAGLQELLLHVHPLVGAVIIPGLTALGLVALPFTRPDDDSTTTGIWFRSRQGRRLIVHSLLVGVAATTALVLLDEVGNLADVLPQMDPLMRDGWLPLAVALLGIWGYGRWLRARGATPSEVRMARFTLVLAILLTLTAIGNLFRGVDWQLMWPWQVFA